MNHRQEQLLKELPKCKNIIKRAGIKVGYSESYANTQLPQVIRRCKEFKEYFNEETVKRDIKKVKRLVLKSKDYTNFIRATELESKILGLQIDKSQVTNTNPEKVIISFNSGKQLDCSKSSSENITEPTVDESKVT